MNKIIKKIISVMLVSSMILLNSFSLVLALDEPGTNQQENTATFTLAKQSETPESVTVTVTLTTGTLRSFKLSYSNSESVYSVTANSEIIGFTANADKSVDYAGEELTENTLVATYVITKATATGIVAADIVFTVSECFADEVKETPVTVDITNNIPETHTHVAGDYSTTKVATCISAGEEEAYCTECGELADTRETGLDPNNHNNIDTRVAKPASCSEEGIKETYCKDCLTVISSEPIAKTQHKVVNVYHEASCTEDGYSAKVCSVCKEVISKEIIKATDHSWTEWTVVKKATAQDTGLKTRTCKYCYETEEIVIPRVVVPVSEIILMPESNITMNIGKSTQIYLNVTPEDAIYSAEFVWTSSNTRVATVDENGLVSAVGFGSTTITASTTDGKVKATKKVTVKFSLFQLIVYLIGKLFN